jgi:hypothetical protein
MSLGLQLGPIISYALITEGVAYSEELNDGTVDLVWSDVGVEGSHETGENPIA